MKGKNMKSKAGKRSIDDLRPEYDFDYSKAVRGKYYRRLIEEGSNCLMKHLIYGTLDDTFKSTIRGTS
jgi:hypothetical protein